MKRLLKELLFLKRGERRALFVVSILLFLSVIFRAVIPNIGHNELVADYAFLDQAEDLKLKLDSLGQVRMNRFRHLAAPAPVICQAKFNPNTVSRDELLAMNLPKYVISNMLRYREAGGVFYASSDLKKIYGMDDNVYNAIHDYVSIMTISPGDSTSPLLEPVALNELKALTSPGLLELNGADSTCLVSIKGIGPVYSSRIIKYRSLLGGYYALSQLWEVYGMDSSRFELLTGAVYIDSTLIEQLDINKLSFGELLRHPYLSKQLVTDLIHYRNYAKRITSPDELEKYRIIDSVSYRKITPYLKWGIN